MPDPRGNEAAVRIRNRVKFWRLKKNRSKLTKRERSCADVEEKVVLEGMREVLTAAELPKSYVLHPTMISG